MWDSIGCFVFFGFVWRRTFWLSLFGGIFVGGFFFYTWGSGFIFRVRFCLGCRSLCFISGWREICS